MRYPRQFAALFVDADTIWLQIGSAAWDVATIDQVRQTASSIRRSRYDVVFRSGARKSVVLRMPSDVVMHRCIDPTYDELDSLADDIMKTLPCVAADGWQGGSESVGAWRDRVLPNWRTGFTHSANSPGA